MPTPISKPLSTLAKIKRPWPGHGLFVSSASVDLSELGYMLFIILRAVELAAVSMEIKQTVGGLGIQGGDDGVQRRIGDSARRQTFIHISIERGVDEF